MELADRTIISCLLLSEGAEPSAVRGFVQAVSDGLDAGEEDAVNAHGAFMARARTADRSRPAGLVVRVLAAKRDHDETCRRFGMASSGMEKALAALRGPQGSPLAAKIVLAKALEALGEAASAVSVAGGGARFQASDGEVSR